MVLFFFFNDPATPEFYTLSLHDALPICRVGEPAPLSYDATFVAGSCDGPNRRGDRKSTRLNSSHMSISYAVFCLKKKKHNKTKHSRQTHTPIPPVNNPQLLHTPFDCEIL